MVFNDLFNVEGRLKTIDRRFSLMYNGDGTHTILNDGQFFMRVERGELDDRVVKHVRKTVWTNIYGDILEEVENHNKKIERDKEKETEYLAQCIAEDIRKPLLRAIDY